MVGRVAVMALVMCTAMPAWSAGVEPMLLHVPVASAPSDRTLDIVADGEDFREMGQVEVHYRRIGVHPWRTLGFERRADWAYVARIPAGEVMPPGIEYYVSSGEKGAERLRFATPDEPQRVAVLEDSEAARREVDLVRFDNRRSRAAVAVEYVNFGNTGTAADSMYRIDCGFSYRILGLLRAMTFGGSRMRAHQGEHGWDHGFAELEVSLHDLFAVRLQTQLGANQEHFDVGGLAALRIGLDPGTHVDLSVESAGGFGSVAGFTLAWDTVDRLPMSSSVQVTDLPAHDELAVRLLYRADVPLGGGSRLPIRISYQARTAQVGGLGLGVGYAYEF